MHQWFLNYDGKQEGPMSQQDAYQRAQANNNGLCWREGFAEWIPIESCTELSEDPGKPPVAAATSVANQRADVVEYKIYGEDMQFVEIAMDAGESMVAEAGSLMYKDTTVQMETIFGDGSKNDQGGGFMGKLMGAGKRLVTGESLFTTVFTNNGQQKVNVAFAAPYPGTLIPLHLTNYGGKIVCQKDSFLCAARGVSIGIHFQKKIMTGLFGGEGFIMQKLEGDGLVFVHAGGTILEKELKAGERLDVDTGCIVAMTSDVQFDVRPVGGVKSMLFGGEGVFMAHIQGPGHVWLQSLPFSRMAGRMLAAAPQKGGSRGEGSILGGLGDLLDGDNSF